MKRTVISLFLILFLSLTSLWSADFYCSGQVLLGDVLTGLLTSCNPGDEASFSLSDSSGKVRALVDGVSFQDEDLPGENNIGLIGIDSGLPVGTYTLRAELKRDSGLLEFERPVLIRGRTFKTEDIKLNKAMSNLRSSADPEKLAQSRRLWSILLSVDKGPVAPCDSMISPVESYTITSWFGDRRKFLYTDGGTAGSVHSGVDLANDTGTPITAPMAGKVVLAQKRILTGNSIVLEHFPGVYSIYYHMDTMEVKENEQVVAGDSLGTMGSTGLVTGPHLHWELRVNTIPVDPMKYLDKGLIDKDQIMTIINGY
ncbi:MAG: hypothetical protein B6241_11180 [Spirochaetaceae bacterium 4572_59]|nr:MAG: hypothetical protein B6241_11180 [Spirochaetaceae bacterium 4572_59]